MVDIVERLRNQREVVSREEAAAEILRLSSRVGELEEALKDVSILAASGGVIGDDAHLLYLKAEQMLTKGHLRRARTALKETT